MSILPVLEKTHRVAPRIAALSDSAKKQLLKSLALNVTENEPFILSENETDLAKLTDSDPKKDRLRLNPERLRDIRQGILDVANLSDPSGKTLLNTTLPNGLVLKKLAVPLGVVGVIYESRPNVTLDVTALCLRSGNAVVLRGGSDAWNSNRALVTIIHKTLLENNLPTEVVALLPTDRELLPELLTATRFVDVLIPRGSDQLIQFVRQNATVPTIETGAGVVHLYVHESADLQKAVAIALNAKTSRPSVCNALDCILLDKEIVSNFLNQLAKPMENFGVEIHADSISHQLLKIVAYPFLVEAETSDYGKEWLDYKLTIKVVSGPEEALEHIARFSSRHSEAIVAEDKIVIDRFLSQVDAAAVYANASTRFTDGGEFGLGAEIGISTQKLHARGPFALEKLVTEKWVVIGNGQVR